MKKAMRTICFVTALVGFSPVAVADLSGLFAPASDSRFYFQVPLEIRDLHPDILGVEIKCVVTTAQGTPVAAGSVRALVTDPAPRALDAGVLVEAAFMDEQSRLLVDDATNYKCDMVLLHRIPELNHSTGSLPFITPINSMPPFPFGGGWMTDQTGIHASDTPTQGMTDRRFESASNAAFVPLVQGVIPADVP